MAIVTGGGSGFGESICQAYAAEGAKLTLADIRAANGQRVAQSLESAGHEAIFVQTDVSKGSEMQALVDAVLKRFGKIDVMVNNAGTSATPINGCFKCRKPSSTASFRST